jgi:hypothetical protein
VAAMSDDLYELIGFQVQSAADWRRRKAKEFPNDIRNLRAAEELERLAAEIELLEGSEIHKQITEVAGNINRAPDKIGEDIWTDVVDMVSVELRLVGFHYNYDTGTQLLECYRDLLQEALDEALDEVVSVPDIDEQVANDPAVKAAKKAYDEAYAKAYAEARKRL